MNQISRIVVWARRIGFLMILMSVPAIVASAAPGPAVAFGLLGVAVICFGEHHHRYLNRSQLR